MVFTVGEAKKHVESISNILADGDKLKENVENRFTALDADKSGHIDLKEATDLVVELSRIMSLPPPTPEEMEGHFKALDQDQDGGLSVTEVGSGVVASFQYKLNSLKHFLAFAERDQLPDDAELPHE
eukprot:TRINITY_DN16671_c0_g1_i4.p1 TRINITY_DN16671_c0_g1~~TRINITY_DN16671_c0_g1_i4.p1  ORF type:complete len:127 (+),score=55.42 TRINITY_DN16671_c0_g1_i4:228-608(+)